MRASIALLSQVIRSNTWQALKESLADAIVNHCCSFRQLQQLRCRVILLGLGFNLYVSSIIISKSCGFGDVESARLVFDGLRQRPTKALVWNSMIRGYLKNGLPGLALDVYEEMELVSECEPDKQTFHLAINACNELSEFELGCRVGDRARRRGFDSDLLIATELVGLYCKMGDFETARRVFDRMSVRDVVLWNAMISGYSQGGHLCEVMDLFRSMRFMHRIPPTEATLVNVMSGCANSGSIKTGEVMIAHSIKSGFEDNLFVFNSLIAMYIDCDCLIIAEQLFERLVFKDAVSWSIMIGGLVRDNRSNDALQLFHRMISSTKIAPTKPILLNALLACANLGNWQEGLWIEETYFRCENRSEFGLDASLITMLIYMHAKCGKIEISLKLLHENVLVRRDVIAWNSMLKACTELRQIEKVLDLTLQMQRKGINPDKVTFITLLSAISVVPLPRKGIETHAQIIKRVFESERSISNSLIDMYAKCGSLGDSQKVFNCIHEKDVVSWSSLIKAYAWNGNAKEALNVFHLMIESGTRANHLTFLAIFSACGHAGFVKEGKELFKSMKEEFNLEPGIEHFTCIVDNFCRAGLLNDTFNLLHNEMNGMGMNAALWGTLLNACRVHGDVVIGEAAAKQLFCLEPGNAANYVMLADVYAAVGRREDANNVLRMLRERGLERRPGCSWFEVVQRT
ncbi:TPR-like protein [Dioscorea alata]|uniref:TPR-like protein n=1 Tax=Dioscorea alata TaxID=55571 RepID=A0ACB7TSK9_DIOAL|nr:TPR-like protein [Dioscorea alata]